MIQEVLLFVDMGLVQESARVIEEIENQFEANPTLGLKLLRELKTADFRFFIATASELLRSGKDLRLSRLILHMIRENEETLDQLLFEDDTFAPETAASIAMLAVKLDPKLQPHWIVGLQNEIEKGNIVGKAGRVIRRLDILARCSELIRLAPTLTQLCRHSDARIRSKAVLLLAQLPSGVVAAGAIEDSDARVRANAIEAMWGRSDKQAIEVFEVGSRDTHQRIGANSLIGLHNAGQLSAIRGILRMADDTDPVRSAAGIWAMGHSKDPRFLDYLQQRLRDTADPHRKSIIRAARLIKQNKDHILSLPRLNMELTRFENGGLGRTEFSFLTINSRGRAVSPCEIQPNQFLVHDGDRRVDQFRVDIKGSAQPFHILFLLPLAEFRTAPFPERLDEVMEAAIDAKRNEDLWAVERYQTSSKSELRYATSIDFITSSDTLRFDQLRFNQPARNKFEASVDELIPIFPANATQKHLVLVASPAWDANFEVPARWVERCKRYGVIPHLLTATLLEDKAFDSWKSFCFGLGGSMIEFDWERELESTFSHFSLGLQSRFEMTCHFVNIAANHKNPDPIKVEIFSEIGYAQLRLDPSGKVLEAEA